MGVILNGGLGGCLQEAEDTPQYVALEVGIVGDAEGSSERERDPERARRLEDLGVFADQADAGGRDAVSLDGM